jgi:predicted secreted Zn-dependent protease
LEAQVANTTKALLESHDEEQAQFDRVEAANFDARMMRLLQYKLQQKKR